MQRLRLPRFAKPLAYHVLAVLDKRNEPPEALAKAGELYSALHQIFKSVDSVRGVLERYWQDPSPGNRETLLNNLENAGQYLGFAWQMSQACGWHIPFVKERVGLAFSGGGIRSATFNLGVLQALAKLKLLYRFDYLSTVSGGGYIGSWLVAWIKRQGFEEVNRQLKPQWKEHGGQEPPPIRFLRDYSNYLTPQLGAFSADTWTVIATYLRNLCLNLMILVLALSALLLVPRILLLAHHSWFRSMDAAFLIWPWILTGLAITTIVMNLSSLFELSDRRSENRYFAKPWEVQLLVIFPILTTAWLLSLWLWAVRSDKVTEWWHWAVVTGLAFSLLWIVGWMVAEVIREQISRTTPTETEIVQDRPFEALIRRGYTRTVDFAEVAAYSGARRARFRDHPGQHSEMNPGTIPG